MGGAGDLCLLFTFYTSILIYAHLYTFILLFMYNIHISHTHTNTHSSITSLGSTLGTYLERRVPTQINYTSQKRLYPIKYIVRNNI